jgi:putative phosphoribosyl transferase
VSQERTPRRSRWHSRRGGATVLRMRFRDRREAGRLLGQRLLEEPEIGGPGSTVVAGLPRGGVPVAYEVAKALEAPLDVLVVRKLGVPWQPELGMGAVGEEGVVVLNPDIVRLAGISSDDLAAIERRERAEVDARAERFRRGRAAVALRDRTVVIVDDGLATGGTARAAIAVARARGASGVVLAVPVAPADVVALLGTEADAVVCLLAPSRFTAVGSWYRDFRQTTDSEVVDLLQAPG